MAEFRCFGRFALGPEGRLYADGTPVPLGPTDARVLAVLVEHAGTLVPKEDLVSRVWRRTAISDDVLYAHIKNLRKIIGDDCIVTKQGRGYRFVGQIQCSPRPLPHAADLLRSGNLPSVEGLTRLIGRSEQLRVVSKLLGRCRLLTVTGPGGVGKTKFALYAANRCAVHFPEGVWLVELASLEDADLAAATAAALGVELRESATPLDTLRRHLRCKSVLVVLDNCEHAISSAAILCEAVLGAAPGVKILATSREPLGCSGEQVFELPPLVTPAAVELFVERAMNADAAIRITDADEPIAAKICRRLDGLPLAIEMAAGWASVLGLETLDAKLDGSINDWLRAGITAPQRHSTLRETLEWSYGLLSADERTVFRRLAVFPGSFDLQAAEAIAGGEDVSSEQVFEHVASLVRKSVVTIFPGPKAPRYRLLETTRTFMLEKMTAWGDSSEIRRRHVRYMLCILEKGISEWETTSDSVWRNRYGGFIDDVRAALDWTMKVGSDDAIALAGTSWLLWRELGLRAEGRRRLGAAVAQLRSDTSPELEARLRRGLGDMSLHSAPTVAYEELTRAVTLYGFLDDPLSIGSALSALASALFMLGRVNEANTAILEALNCLAAQDGKKTLAAAYSIQLCVEALLGRYEAARTAGEKSVQLCEMAGADRPMFVALGNLIQVSLEMNDFDAAIVQGHNLAERLRKTPYSDVLGFVLSVLNGALTMRGNLPEALAIAREAAPLLREQGTLYWLFDHVALCCALAGRITESAILAGYTDAVYRQIGHPREPMGCRAVERLRVFLDERLPAREVRRLAEMGAQFSEEQALTLALTG